MLKKILLIGYMLVAICVLSGCDAVTQALDKIGDDIEAAQVQSPGESDKSGLDWSFVPVVRDLATKMFTEGVPDATIRDTRVASKSGQGDRVIVIIEYAKDGKTGSYGFDYEKNAAGEYELRRLGEGVRTDDLN